MYFLESKDTIFQVNYQTKLDTLLGVNCLNRDLWDSRIFRIIEPSCLKTGLYRMTHRCQFRDISRNPFVAASLQMLKKHLSKTPYGAKTVHRQKTLRIRAIRAIRVIRDSDDSHQPSTVNGFRPPKAISQSCNTISKRFYCIYDSYQSGTRLHKLNEDSDFNSVIF